MTPIVDAPKRWLLPGEIVALAFARSPVVMMNEAHNAHLRSVRTRRSGIDILPTAHAAGCRHLAMEALPRDFAAEANETRSVPDADQGYLSQPEMRDLIDATLRFGWTLLAYEADFALQPPTVAPLSRDEANWRDDQQARNLVQYLETAAGGQLLVWCGNSHLTKRVVGGDGTRAPMGRRFWELSGIEPFAIDQIQSVQFDGGNDERDERRLGVLWAEAFAHELDACGGTAGFLVEELAECWKMSGVDAVVLSTDNAVS